MLDPDRVKWSPSRAITWMLDTMTIAAKVYRAASPSGNHRYG